MAKYASDCLHEQQQRRLSEHARKVLGAGGFIPDPERRRYEELIRAHPTKTA